MKVTSFGDLLHHMINKTNFDSESDFITAHAIVDEKYPTAPTAETQATPPATPEEAAAAEAAAAEAAAAGTPATS